MQKVVNDVGVELGPQHRLGGRRRIVVVDAGRAGSHEDDLAFKDFRGNLAAEHIDVGKIRKFASVINEHLPPPVAGRQADNFVDWFIQVKAGGDCGKERYGSAFDIALQ